MNLRVHWGRPEYISLFTSNFFGLQGLGRDGRRDEDKDEEAIWQVLWKEVRKEEELWVVTGEQQVFMTWEQIRVKEAEEGKWSHG